MIFSLQFELYINGTAYELDFLIKNQFLKPILFNFIYAKIKHTPPVQIVHLYLTFYYFKS